MICYPVELGGGGSPPSTGQFEKVAKASYEGLSITTKTTIMSRVERLTRDEGARYASYIIVDSRPPKEREDLEEKAKLRNIDIYKYVEDEFKRLCSSTLDNFISAIKADVEAEIGQTEDLLAAQIARLEAITYELKTLNDMMQATIGTEANASWRQERMLTNKNYLTYLYNRMGELYEKYGLTLFDDMTAEEWQNGNAFEDIYNEILYDKQNLFDDIATIQEQEDLYNLINQYKDLLNQRYHIKWFRKNVNYKGTTDKQAGIGWEPLNDIQRIDGSLDGTATEITTYVQLKPILINEDHNWALIMKYLGVDERYNADISQNEKVHLFQIGETIIACNYSNNYTLQPYFTFDSMTYTVLNMFNFESMSPVDNTYYKIPVAFTGSAPSNDHQWGDEILEWLLDFGSAEPLVDFEEKTIANNPYPYWINSSTDEEIVTRNDDADFVIVQSNTIAHAANRNDAPLLNKSFICYASETFTEEKQINVPAKYVLNNPKEIFTLENVDLDPKKTTQTFKAIASYDNTFTTSNEVTFQNQSTDYLVEQFSDINSKFKVQLVRPRYVSLNEQVPEDNLFKGSFVADDSISEFFVFDERGHAIENPDGIPYDSVTYYAFLMIRNESDDVNNYSILQYNQPQRDAIAEESLYLDKFKNYNPEVTDELAVGYLSEWDKKVIAAYLNIASFDTAYQEQGRTQMLNALTASVRSQLADDLTAAYAINWNMDITAAEVNPGSTTMFKYLHRMTTDQVNERFGFEFSTNTTVFVLEFRIKDSYSLSNARPVDRLALNINYNNVNYTAEREFHFGNASTMGSNYNISIMVRDHASDLSNAPILRLDKYHMILPTNTDTDDALGTYQYDLIANIHKKNGLPLSDEERAKCQIYWYLNSGLKKNGTTEDSNSYYALTIEKETGTLLLTPKTVDFFTIDEPVIPPIITVRVDGLENYSLYYSVPFQVWKAARALDNLQIINYSVSCPNRIAFNSSGTNPAYDRSAFEVVDHNNKYIYMNLTDLAESLNFTLHYNERNLITNLLNLRRAIRLPDDEAYIEFDPNIIDSSVWTWRRTQYEIIDRNAQLISDDIDPETQTNPREVFISDNRARVNRECEEKESVIDEYEASLKAGYIPTTLENVPEWTLTFKYRSENSASTAAFDTICATVVNNIGTNYFINLDEGEYSQELDVSSWMRIKETDSQLGKTYSLMLVDGENTQWEDKLRNAHTYLSVKLRDGTWVTQAIVFERQVYCSSLVNAWGGTEITIDDNNNATLSKRIVVGSKDANNTFTGMIMGDWANELNDGSIDVPGLYGFKAGAQTYGLLTTGEAFFGPAGAGRIYINKHAGVISNANMTSYINLNPRVTDIISDNVYDIRQKGYSPYFLYTESEKSDINASNVQWNDLLKVAEEKDVFAVDPHRGIFMSGGIHAGWGDIGGWQITDAGLTKKKNNSKIYLGVGNKTSTNKEFAEELYLYLINEIYLNPISKAETQCRDHSLITEINRLLTTPIALKDGTTTTVVEDGNELQIGVVYSTILVYIHRYLMILLRDQYPAVDDVINHFFPAIATHQVAAEENKSNYDLFIQDVAEVTVEDGHQIQPEILRNIFYYLNTMIVLHKQVYTDGYIEQYRYKFIYLEHQYNSPNDYSPVNLDEHRKEIEIAYSSLNSSGGANTETGNYYIWSGPAATPMSKQNRGTFSVDYNGDLYAESGVIGGWGFTDTKLYSTVNLDAYMFDETGHRMKNALGQYIRTQANSFVAELDAGTINASAGMKYPYFALLNKSILLESGSGGGANTFARMGFYYDPTISYDGRMLRRLDISEIPYTENETTGAVVYDSTISLPYYNNGILTYTEDIPVTINPNGPTYLTTGGYNIVIDGTNGTIKLGECQKEEPRMVDVIDPMTGQVQLNPYTGEPMKEPVKDQFGNIITDTNYYPAIELNGRNGQISLYHNNIILDGKANKVSIGAYDDNGEIVLVGFQISSRDYRNTTFPYITQTTELIALGQSDSEDYSYNATVNNNKTTVTANISGNIDGWTDANTYTYSNVDVLGRLQLQISGVEGKTPDGIHLDLDTPVQAQNSNYVLEGSELRFTLKETNGYGQRTNTDSNTYYGFSAVAGWKYLVGQDPNDPLTQKTSHVILTPTVNLTYGNLEEANIFGLLFNWNLVADWISANRIIAHEGCYGPDGIYASLKYVNQQLANLAGQISSLSSKLNAGVGNLAKLIQAVAGDSKGLDAIINSGLDIGTSNYKSLWSMMQERNNVTNTLETAFNTVKDTVDDLPNKYAAAGHTHTYDVNGYVECGASEGHTHAVSFHGISGTTGAASSAS